MLLEKFELSSEPMLRDVKTLTQKAPTSVSWRCTRCVVECEKSEVASAEEGHDVTCHRDDACEEPSLNRSSTCHATSDEDREGFSKSHSRLRTHRSCRLSEHGGTGNAQR